MFVSERPARMSRTQKTLLVTALTALGAVTAFAFVGNRSIWYDEGISEAFARLPWPVLWSAIHRVDAPEALYYALLHFWHGFTNTTVGLRALSAVAAVAMVPFAFGIARRMFDSTIATIAALLIVFSPFFIHYADEMRPYALAMFFSVVATYAFLRSLESAAPRFIVAYGIAALLAVYFHLFAVLLIVAHALTIPLLSVEPKRAARRFSSVFAAIALFTVPLVLLVHGSGIHQISWIPSVRPRDAFALVQEFSGSGPAAIVSVVFILSALISLRSIANRRSTLACLVWTVIPIIAAYAISLKVPVFLPRYLIATFAPFVILISVGIVASRVRLVILAAILILLALDIRVDWATHDKSLEDYRAAAIYLHHVSGADDAILVYPPRVEFSYEAALRDTGLPQPSSLIHRPSAYLFWREPADAPAPPSSTELRGRARVWLVMRGYSGRPAWRTVIEALLQREFRLGKVVEFGDVSVSSYQRVGSP